jgi:hypothetical protein
VRHHGSQTAPCRRPPVPLLVLYINTYTVVNGRFNGIEQMPGWGLEKTDKILNTF